MISLCGFTIGTSIEIVIFVSLFLSVIIFSYNCIIFLFSGYKNINHLKFNLDNKFYIPVLVMFIGAFLFTSSEGFKQVANSNINRFFGRYTPSE